MKTNKHTLIFKLDQDNNLICKFQPLISSAFSLTICLPAYGKKTSISKLFCGKENELSFIPYLNNIGLHLKISW